MSIGEGTYNFETERIILRLCIAIFFPKCYNSINSVFGQEEIQDGLYKELESN